MTGLSGGISEQVAMGWKLCEEVIKLAELYNMLSIYVKADDKNNNRWKQGERRKRISKRGCKYRTSKQNQSTRVAARGTSAHRTSSVDIIDTILQPDNRSKNWFSKTTVALTMAVNW